MFSFAFVLDTNCLLLSLGLDVHVLGVSELVRPRQAWGPCMPHWGIGLGS
jgi:hypothetical protein